MNWIINKLAIEFGAAQEERGNIQRPWGLPAPGLALAAASPPAGRPLRS